MSDLYLATGDLDRAEQALLRADAIAPRAEVTRRLADLDARRRAAALPREYAAIETAEAITRGQLAALLGVQFGPLLAGLAGDGAAIITDARDHWAYGLDDRRRAGRNHAGRRSTTGSCPGQVVGRAEFARVLVRMLRAAGVEPMPPAGLPRLSDLDPRHLDYPAASEVVAEGLLPALSGNAFRPGLPVSGGEAMAALSRLGRATGTGRRESAP